MMSQAQHEGHSLHDFYAEIQKAANEYGFEKIEDFGDAMTTIAFIEIHWGGRDLPGPTDRSDSSLITNERLITASHPSQSVSQPTTMEVKGQQYDSVGWLTWGKSSMMKLAEAERRLFATFGAQILSRFVPIRFKGSEVYTVTVEPTLPKKSDDPIVLVHGFGAGVAVWGANLSALAKHNSVHAFDLLGFGRSSRPRFSNDPTLSELEMVESIEDWRKSMGIEKMYLVAHSFGAYLASSYALEHPNRVKHLVLVDPWGFPEKIQATEKQITPYPWMMFIGGVLSYFNPLATLRVAGPYGPSIVKKLRPDLSHRYKSENPDDIYEYLYLCNAQSPTGETAFKSMTLPFGWAKRPMIKRFNGIDDSVPVTFIYGSKSWIDPGPAFDIQAQRNGYVDVQIIRGAGHHVYADAPDAFNEVVCSIVNGEHAHVDVENDSDKPTEQEHISAINPLQQV